MSLPSNSQVGSDASRSHWLWRGVEPVACALAPGVLAGTQLGGLLFFLNPHWPFEPWLLLRTMGFYGALLGAGSTIVLLPFTWRRPARARRILPWSLVVVFTLASVLHGANASHYSYYLPAGINRRLIKAALWLFLAAVISFYTALLHSLRRRPYGARSRVGFALLAALAVYVVLERREAFDPPPEISPRPSTVEAQRRPNVLVVGIQSATLDVVLPLAERGQLPFLASFLQSGAYARLETIEPTVSAPLWMSVATGKLPFRHGVLGAHRFSAEFLGDGLDFRLSPAGLRFTQWGIPGGQLPWAPETKHPDRDLALWEITARLGFEVSVLSWPGSGEDPPQASLSGGEPAVANAIETKEVDWGSLPPTDRSLSSAAASDGLHRFSNLTVPQQALAGRSASRDMAYVREALDLFSSRRSEPSHELPAVAVFLHLPGLESIAKTSFGGYSAVEFEGRRGSEATAAYTLVVGYYSWLDERLAEMWSRLPEPRLMVVVSAFGARTDRGLEKVWTSVWPQRTLQGHFDGAPDGVLLLRGEGILPGHFVTGAKIVDLAPTLLYALGFPVARDFDGRVLDSAFSEEFLRRRPVTFVPSYRTLSETRAPLRRPDRAPQ